MNQMAKFALTLLAGFALGAGAIQGLHAEAGNKPGYVVAEVDVIDAPAFQTYAAKAAETIKAAGGRVLVRAKAKAEEGEPPHGEIVILAFDSIADAEKWYSTPPYQPLIAEREDAADTRLYLVEGLPQ
jgi:uncharacterized protein (DUF1330 family)